MSRPSGSSPLLVVPQPQNGSWRSSSSATWPFTTEPAIRQRFEGLSPTRLVKAAASLRPRPTDPVRYATLLAIRTLARRVAYLQRETAELTRVIQSRSVTELRHSTERYQSICSPKTHPSASA